MPLTPWKTLTEIKHSFSSLEWGTKFLVITTLFWAVPSSMSSQFVSLYMKEIGASPTNIGLFTAITLLVSMLFLPLAGYLADAYGRKYVMIIFDSFAIGTTLVEAWSGFIGDWRFFFLSSFIQGLTAIGGTFFTLMILESVPPEKRSHAFIAYRVCMAIPALFMPSIGYALISSFGLIHGVQISLIANAISIFLASLLRIRYLKDIYQQSIQKSHSERRLISFDRINHVVSEELETVSWLSKHSNAVKVWLFMTMDAFAVNVTTKYTSLYIVDYLQLDPFILALLPIISTSVTVLTMLFVATPYFANQGKKLQRIILLTSLIAPVSSIIFLLAYDFTSLAISQILGVIGSSIYNPASNALWMNMIPRNRRGRIFALTALMRSIIILPAPVIGGYFFEWINPRAPFFILTAFECFAVLIIASAKEPDFQEI